MADMNEFCEPQDEIQAHLEARYPWLATKRLDWGYEIGRGWLKILEDFFAKVDAALPGGAGFTLRQAKEKMGGLRLAYLISDDVPAAAAARISIAHQLAYARAYYTCEVCGAPGSLYSIGGWWTTVCAEHAEAKATGRKAKPFQRVTDHVGTIAAGLLVRYLPREDRLTIERDHGDRTHTPVTAEEDARAILAEATRFVEMSRAAERLEAAQCAIAAEGKMSDLEPHATEIDVAEEATRLQKEAREELRKERSEDASKPDNVRALDGITPPRKRPR